MITISVLVHKQLGSFMRFWGSSFSDDILENDSDSEVWLVHDAAAQGDTSRIVKAVQNDPSVLELEDSEGKYGITCDRE